MDPDPAPVFTPDSTPFFSDFKAAKINFFSSYSFYNLLTGTLSSVLKKLNLLLKFCVKIIFCKHYFSPLNTFMRKGKEPDPYL